MSEMARDYVIARQPFALHAKQVENAMKDVLPEPLNDHFVIVGWRRYPPKQVLARVTGLDRAEFTTHHARRILTGLGFPAGRRSRDRPTPVAAPRRGGNSVDVGQRPTAETLEPFVGEWVATRGPEVLVSAADPRSVVAWLAKHGEIAESMFRVPADDFEASGMAPM